MNRITSDVSKELVALSALPDNEVDFSDIPASDPSDWNDAIRGKFYRPIKQQVTVRLDADILAWLKSGGAGYQSRLNMILRQSMQNAIQGNAEKRRV